MTTMTRDLQGKLKFCFSKKGSQARYTPTNLKRGQTENFFVVSSFLLILIQSDRNLAVLWSIVISADLGFSGGCAFNQHSKNIATILQPVRPYLPAKNTVFASRSDWFNNNHVSFDWLGLGDNGSTHTFSRL